MTVLKKSLLTPDKEMWSNEHIMALNSSGEDQEFVTPPRYNYHEQASKREQVEQWRIDTARAIQHPPKHMSSPCAERTIIYESPPSREKFGPNDYSTRVHVSDEVRDMEQWERQSLSQHSLWSRAGSYTEYKRQQELSSIPNAYHSRGFRGPPEETLDCSHPFSRMDGGGARLRPGGAAVCTSCLWRKNERTGLFARRQVFNSP